MLSKSQIKNITLLKQKKHRKNTGLFVAEGVKVIQEFINAGLSCKALYCTAGVTFDTDCIAVSPQELKKISFLTTPQKAIALFEMPKLAEPIKQGLQVALDEVRDPGNLGTIIRLCDWYGVTDVVCSKGTVDCYNPKVVQATMGSLSRVNVHYVDLVSYLKETTRTVYGTFMDGGNIYTHANLSPHAILVMGNEGQGISEVVEQQVTKRISIPRFGELQHTESLNVAMATAVVLSEFKRKEFTEK